MAYQLELEEEEQARPVPERTLAAAVLLLAVDDYKNPSHQRALEHWSQGKEFLFWCQMADLEDGAIENLQLILQGRRATNRERYRSSQKRGSMSESAPS